ncbi:hypothetical protein ISF_06879 [Cordyceps fumosorosea ARSEF 2679]|uniref:LPXTG-motif cell wall anchor n=1 Tax=Cordyceps fumosorosea (strain ARSEF 2679) TaxID=1081104 RepID=A0A167R7E5_CORFA|nr:hypothetical protein ISF_06879 [Cordyceps fumosorosea ARSEF 2679]OAA58340.1 hypothetical protein ISF_06879 [Cordyceps fumosorosea ARSEF 2679]
MHTVTKTSEGSAGETTQPDRLANRAPGSVKSTNLGSLDPSFTPATACTSLTIGVSFDVQDGTTTTVGFNWGRTCSDGWFLAVDTSCYPPSYATAYVDVIRRGRGSDTFPVHSPASRCPERFSSACGFGGPNASVDSTRRDFDTVMSSMIAETQTAVGRCPSGYLVFAAAPCLVLVRDVPATESATTTTTTTMTTTGALASPPSTATGTNSTAAAPSSRGGLSTAAAGAIGAAVPLALMLAALVVFVLLRKRSRRSAAAAQSTQTGADLSRKESSGPIGGDCGGAVEMDGSDQKWPGDTGRALTDPAAAIGVGASLGSASELHTSIAQPRSHDAIVELPAEAKRVCD